MNANTQYIDEQIERFRNCRVKHAILARVLDEAMFYLHDSPSTGIVNIVGPTGAGKTMVRNEIEASTIKLRHEEMVRHRHVRPVISTTALASGNTKFAWSDLCQAALLELGDPFSVRSSPEHFDEEFRQRIEDLPKLGSRPTLARVRYRLAAEFMLRKTVVWCIDEVQHAVFEDRKGGATPEHQLAVFKSIVQLASTKLLLLGPPNVARQFFTNGQLSRRSRTVYFTRYRADKEDELREFCRVCNTLLHHMKPASVPTLQDIGQMLYSGTAGCIGVLKDWLERALTIALKRAGNPVEAVVTIDDLRETRIDPEALEAMLRDIHYMERSVVDRSDDALFDRMVHGTGGGGIALPATMAPAKPRSTAARGRTKPGVRGPGRDATGPDAIWGTPR
jgi:hypothetical protein